MSVAGDAEGRGQACLETLLSVNFAVDLKTAEKYKVYFLKMNGTKGVPKTGMVGFLRSGVTKHSEERP